MLAEHHHGTSRSFTALGRGARGVTAGATGGKRCLSTAGGSSTGLEHVARFQRQLAWYCVPLLLLFSLLLGCSKLNSDVAPAGPSIATQPVASAKGSAQGRAVPDNHAQAILAGGCFWGMEEILRQIPGVIETEVGYTGGKVKDPSYDVVSRGISGHAEAVRIVYDRAKLSYRDLLAKWFFRMHDPTTKDRQGNDVGNQYRSAIFVTHPEQRAIAEQVIKELNQSGKFEDPIVTTIEPAGPFTPAEAYHQDYLQKNPGGYSCHYLRDWT